MSAQQQTRLVTVGPLTYSTTLHTPPNASSSTPLVLCCHALMADSSMWSSTVTTLVSHGYRVLTYDHPGHGSSPAPPAHLLTQSPIFNFDDMTKHMHALAQSITGQSSPSLEAVIGCSMGGVLALRYSMLYPSQVRRVISIGAPGIKALEAAKPLWTQRIEVFRKDIASGTNELCKATVERWLPGSEPRSVEARRLALEETKRCGIEGYELCADAIRDYDYENQLGEVEAVVMIVAGDRDGAIGPRENLEGVAKKIKKCEYVWLQGAGHIPPLHLPDEFNALVSRFLKDGPRS